MPFAQKADLKQSIQNYAARTNAEFLNRIDDFINLVEARMQYGSTGALPSDPLRTKSQERVVTLTTSSSFQVVMPPDLLEIRAIYQALNQKNIGFL